MRLRHRARAGVLVIVMGLAVGACSGATGRTGPAAGHSPGVVATFVAAGRASAQELADDAHELTTRLRSYGDSNATTSVHGHAVVVSGTTGLPVPGSLLVASGTFQIRPALCQSAPYGPETPPPAPAASVPTGCSSPRYSLLAPNLSVDGAGNSDISSIAPDPVLAGYPSSSAVYNDSHPDSSVLVPGTDGEGDVRYLLGPTALDATMVADATATTEDAQWLVDVQFTAVGASAWDAVAEKYFHELLAVDVDGVAVSVPLTQPAQSTFTSFDGKMQLSGNFTKRTAEQIAAILASGPLTVALSS